MQFIYQLVKLVYLLRLLSFTSSADRFLAHQGGDEVRGRLGIKYMERV